MNQLSYRQFQILKYIFNSSQYTTANYLSSKLGISVRTVKTEINEINKMIKIANCSITSKNGKGYLVVRNENYDDELLSNLCPNQCNLHEGNTLNPYSERVQHVIKKLLVIDYHIKLEDLAEELFISRTVMSQIMKEIRSRLSKFRLKVVSRPNYGILVEGSEIDKRLAIAEYFFHDQKINDYQLEASHMFSNADAREEYDMIFEIVRKNTLQFGIEMSDFSIHNLVIHLKISISRCRFYNYIIAEDNIVSKWQNTLEFRTAIQIMQELEHYCNFMFPIGESIYLAQHLRSKRIIDNNLLSTEDEILLHKCLEEIMNEVNNNFGLGLSENCEWYNYMLLHIPQMIERLRIHMTIRNPLVMDNMRRYLFATKITHSVCQIIEKFYKVKVDLNEFGYLLLYFNLEVTRFELNKPLKIVIFSGRGRPESLMIVNEIKEQFSSHKYKITEVKKVEPKGYDLGISTYKIDERCDYPIIIIDDDNYIEKIKGKIDELRYKKLDLDIFCREEYCTFELDGSTKEEVMNNFYKELEKKNLIKDNSEQVFELLDDELGNGIVHLQDTYRMIRNNMLYVCTLKKAIYWNKEMVRILILTKTKKEHDKDLFNLCRVVSKWANDVIKVNRLLKNQNFNELKEDFKEKL